MKCPTCGAGEDAILRTEVATDDTVRRRRACAACGKRWWTREAPESVYERAAGVVEVFRELHRRVGEE